MNRHRSDLSRAKIDGAIHLEQMFNRLPPLLAAVDMNADCLPVIARDVDLVGEVPDDRRSIAPDERGAIGGKKCTHVCGNLARAQSHLAQKTVSLVRSIRGKRSSHQAVPAWMRSLELRCGPATNVTKSERYAWRSAHAGMAMHDDPLSVGPGIDELCDGPRVILGEQNIRWLSLL